LTKQSEDLAKQLAESSMHCDTLLNLVWTKTTTCQSISKNEILFKVYSFFCAIFSL
jgi:hypothetical protein